MNEFDDPQVEHILGRLSGAYPDTNVAFSAMKGRVRQAKRRRAFVASATACALLGALAVLGVQGGRSADVQPADRSEASEESVDDTMDSVDDTAADTSVDDTMVDDTAVDTSADDTMVDTTVDNSGSGSSSPNSGHGSTGGQHTTTTPTPDGLVSRSSAGGTVTVMVQHGTLTFVSAQPEGGYTEDRSARTVDSHRIRVEFQSGSDRWRVEAEVKDGAVTWTVQHDGNG